MDWIFDHFQIVVLLLLGIGSALKAWLEFKGKALRESEEQPAPERDLSSDKSYRKRAPQGPPPLPSGPAPSGKRLAGYEMEAANEAAQTLKHQQELAARLRQIRENKATITGGASATRARVAEKKGAPKSTLRNPLALRQRLSNPAEVRRAFVLKEILDPPVSLR